jgi:hypothetical protein
MTNNRKQLIHKYSFVMYSKSKTFGVTLKSLQGTAAPETPVTA